MGYIEYFWEGPCIFVSETDHKLYTLTSDATTSNAGAMGILSDTIIPSFFWSAMATDATPVEAVGSGYIRVYQDSDTTTQKTRFSILKSNTSAVVIDAHTIAKSSADVKAWSSKLVVGYQSGIFTMLSESNTVVYETTGAAAWTIDFSVSELDTYMDYVKLDVTGAAGTTTYWRSNAIYTLV